MSRKEQGWTEKRWDVIAPGTDPFRLFVISHKSPGAEIRNEEASCAEIVWHWWLGVVTKLFLFLWWMPGCMQPYKKALFPAGHCKARWQPQTLSCSSVQGLLWDQKATGRCPRAWMEKMLSTVHQKHLWNWFCSALLGLSEKLLCKLQWNDPTWTTADPSLPSSGGQGGENEMEKKLLR